MGLLAAVFASSAAAQQPPPAPPAAAEGFQVVSADGRSTLRIRGGAQVDGRWFPAGDAPGVDWFAARRVRTDLSGSLAGGFAFRIQLDVAQSRSDLLDAFVEAPITGGLRIRAGKTKGPFGLERLQTPFTVTFVERGLPTQLAPNRETGAMLFGTWRGGIIHLAAGVFNGVTNGGSDDAELADPKDLIGRVFLRPLARRPRAPDLGVGVAASTGVQHGKAGSPLLAMHFTSVGREVFFRFRGDGAAATTAIADGRRTRIGPQAHLYAGQLGFTAEYTMTEQVVRMGAQVAEVGIDAGQVTASWVVTGGKPAFGGVRPTRPIDTRRGEWGAIELAARYETLAVDEAAFPVLADPLTAVRAARSVIGGINWYPTAAIRAAINVTRTTFDAAAAGPVRPTETAVVTRFQVVF